MLKRVLHETILAIIGMLILCFASSFMKKDVNAEERGENTHRSIWQNRAGLFQSSAVVQGSQQHVLTYEDLLQLESFPPELYPRARFSPTSGELAYVLQRSKKQEKFHNLWYMDGNDRSDIWLVSDRSKAPINITKGFEDGTGFWNPIWSPDGRYLAMYSTRGPEENIFLWAWQKATGKLTLLSQKGCDPERAEPVWVSDSEIVFSVLPKNEIPPMYDISNETPRIASEAWKKNKSGQDSTDSVLECGIKVDCLQNPEGQLLHFSFTTGETRELGRGRIMELLPSPDRRFVAGLILSALMPLKENQLIRSACDERYQIRFYDKNGSLASKVLSNVKSVVPGTLKWSSDGSRLLFLGSYNEDEGAVERRPRANWEAPNPYVYRRRGPQMVFVYYPSEDKLDEVPLKNLWPVEDEDIRFHLGWSPKNQVLIYAGTFSEVSNIDYEQHQTSWWILKKDNSPICLTKKLMNPSPLHIYPEKDHDSWINLSDGNIWRIKEEGNQIINITKDKDKKISSIIWVDSQDVKGISKLIYQVNNEHGKSELCLLDLVSDEILIIAKPAEKAEFVTYSSSTSRALFIDNNRNGTYLWLTCPKEGWVDAVVETNTFLRGIKEAETMSIDYKSLDGEPLTGWILLPVDYKKGQIYPMATWVYPGEMESKNTPNYLTQMNYCISLNMQLLAAQGYAVLFPSMPGPFASYLGMTKGVLPAIDKAIELGIADPERLAIMGHSAGGLATYGLITQTNLFKAAIALAGPSDLISFYLQFDIRKRYGKNALSPRFYPMGYVEGFIEGHMPPWLNEQEYIQNSPIFHVERVRTPTLIFHSDVDGVNIGQSEEFYKALYRQGKRARFVRYWGDDHVITNPANARNMWGHILNWLKENGCPPNYPR